MHHFLCHIGKREIDHRHPVFCLLHPRKIDEIIGKRRHPPGLVSDIGKPFILPELHFEHICVRVYDRKRCLDLMPGIGDKPFLLLIVFRHRPYDPLEKKEDQNKDRHKSKRSHPDADDQKSPETGKCTPAIQKHDLHFIRVNAQERFYSKLAGVSDPEKKRKIIGEEFIRVFEEEAKKIGAVDFLVQGTIYPDVIESGLGKSAVIKSHHNVGGLPDCVDFKEIIEPLRLLFKDEVRRAGLELGIPEYLVYRQPFPGPGLGVRIVGEVTPEKVRIVQDADAIYREELAKAGCDKGLGQFFAALTNMRSVGVMGDERTYDYAVALRAVITSDFMTAEAAEIPFDVLFKVMTRVINEVKGVNRVLYDLTSKPPGTIEFE